MLGGVWDGLGRKMCSVFWRWSMGERFVRWCVGDLQIVWMIQYFIVDEGESCIMLRGCTCSVGVKVMLLGSVMY